MQTTNQIINKEQDIIKKFFNWSSFVIPDLPEWVDDKIIAHWQKLNFDLHYLPKISLERDMNLSLWKDKPDDVFYKNIKQGKIAMDSKDLQGKWTLIDARDKPKKQVRWINSNNVRFLEKIGFNPKEHLKKKNRQLYQNEYLNEILNAQGFVSRFCLSVGDIKKILPFVLDILKINSKQIIRLPRFIEYNYLGNAFYPQWATTKTWEWFEDKFEQNQNLAGGWKSVGSLGWDPPMFWSTILGFRPIIEISTR